MTAPTTQELTTAELTIGDSRYTIVVDQVIRNESLIARYNVYVIDPAGDVIDSSDTLVSDPAAAFEAAAGATFAHWLAAREGGGE